MKGTPGYQIVAMARRRILGTCDGPLIMRFSKFPCVSKKQRNSENSGNPNPAAPLARLQRQQKRSSDAPLTGSQFRGSMRCQNGCFSRLCTGCCFLSCAQAGDTLLDQRAQQPRVLPAAGAVPQYPWLLAVLSARDIVYAWSVAGHPHCTLCGCVSRRPAGYGRPPPPFYRPLRVGPQSACPWYESAGSTRGNGESCGIERDPHPIGGEAVSPRPLPPMFTNVFSVMQTALRCQLHTGFAWFTHMPNSPPPLTPQRQGMSALLKMIFHLSPLPCTHTLAPTLTFPTSIRPPQLRIT